MLVNGSEFMEVVAADSPSCCSSHSRIPRVRSTVPKVDLIRLRILTFLLFPYEFPYAFPDLLLPAISQAPVG